jgi:hypothetical protein
VARWRVNQLAADPKIPTFKRFALRSAANGGSIDEIIHEVYALGFVIAANETNDLHREMLQAGSIVKEEA